MDLGIEGRRAAVAAASDGLGLATAQALVAEGVTVAICGRDQARLDRAAGLLGGDTVALRADLSDTDQATGFVRDARERLGGLDIAVLNAGGPTSGPFGGVGLDEFKAAVDLNLLSSIAMCEEAVPPMQAQRWGRVVAITSISVRQPVPYLITSNTVRAGVTGYLKTVASAVAADGVTVNTVQPGSHDTARMRQLTGGDLDAAAAQVPVGRLGEPADFGQVVAFLCSEQAKFITGASLPVEGGASQGLQ
jgi:3-oxoacyl-[acyl-carrier protein] reductase